MNANKLLIGGIVGGVAFFFLGWIIYGMLLMNVMTECGGPGAAAIQKPMEYWAIAISCLIYGFFIAWVFSRYAATPSVGTALQHGAIMGLLIAGTFDFSFYSMTTLLTMKGLLIDVAAYAVYTGLGAAIIAWVMGRGNKTAAA